MKKISIREALKTGWDNFKRRPWYLLGLGLCVLFFFVCTSSQGALITALSYIVYGGYLAVLLKHYDWQNVVFDDLFSIDSRWISFAFVGLIKGVLILLGLVLFIVPGVYLAVRFMFAELLVIDKGMRPLEALRASAAMTKGHMWKLFLFFVVAIVLLMLGLVVFLIGVVVASIVLSFATIKLYKDLQIQQA